VPDVISPPAVPEVATPTVSVQEPAVTTIVAEELQKPQQQANIAQGLLSVHLDAGAEPRTLSPGESILVNGYVLTAETGVLKIRPSTEADDVQQKEKRLVNVTLESTIAGRDAALLCMILPVVTAAQEQRETEATQSQTDVVDDQVAEVSAEPAV
jgi:hypothetical protein